MKSMRKASKGLAERREYYGNSETLGKEARGVERGFVYSHVLTTYYNWKNKTLLKDKLDDMDRLIAEHGEAIAQKLVTNEKFAETLAGYVTKAMMTGQDANDANKVPNSAFIHTLAQQITANQTAITALNADAPNFARKDENLVRSGYSVSNEKASIQCKIQEEMLSGTDFFPYLSIPTKDGYWVLGVYPIENKLVFVYATKTGTRLTVSLLPSNQGNKNFQTIDV